jgi:hypothetical protein
MQLLRSPLPAYLHGSLRSDSSEEKNHAGASLLDERLNRFFHVSWKLHCFFR